MAVLYIDAFAGISGDMTVGALLALGLPLQQLQRELAQLHLAGYTVSSETREVNGIAANKFRVHVSAQDPTHRAFRDIRALLEHSSLQPEVKRHALAIFGKLAAAEARVHGVQPDDVEFHEVGAIDSIIDVVGTALGVVTLGIESAYVSPLPLGSGRVQTRHGPLPVPGPATLELLRGFTTRPGDGDGELVTPTGAAIVAALAKAGPVPAVRITAVGYGAGERVQKDRPNLLRLVLCELADAAARDDVVVIETNIDDFNPELYDHVMERLFEAGARDVYLTPVHMKKNRPGVLLSVLGTETDRDQLVRIILSETSAIGVRFHPARRLVLERQLREVGTPYGPVRVKVAVSPDGSENLAPEYEDCKRVAREKHVPIKLVYQAALTAAASGSARK
jgi:uncharacterized protein (TIGR00299 family) protein